MGAGDRQRVRGQRPSARPSRTAASGRRTRRAGDGSDLLLIHRATVSEVVAVEVDRPTAFRPRLTGFWRGTEFCRVARVVATRWEHGVTYYRLLTDCGAFDLRHIMRLNPLTLKPRRVWEVCAELDMVPVAHLP